MIEPKLEINEKEYTFVANRKAICALSEYQNKQDKSEMLDDMFHALLKKEHNLSKEEVSELLDFAEQEYGTEQLMEFATEIINEAFTQVGKKQYKKIAFLNHKKK